MDIQVFGKARQEIQESPAGGRVYVAPKLRQTEMNYQTTSNYRVKNVINTSTFILTVASTG